MRQLSGTSIFVKIDRSSFTLDYKLTESRHTFNTAIKPFRPAWCYMGKFQFVHRAVFIERKHYFLYPPYL